ncbi:DNA mismatch repair protein [Vibrio barjaei]|nr:DNA mismatch repair protein [Vibrio barjaei]
MTDYMDEHSTPSYHIEKEENRRNTNISFVVFGRATIFHPSSRLTPAMKRKLEEVAKQGGAGLTKPLESVEVSAYGTKYQIDLHNHYLLVSHREVLESILGHGNIIKLTDESYKAGQHLTWQQIYESEGMKGKEIDRSSTASRIPAGGVVLSISMYKLATVMGIKPIKANYNAIANRIFELQNTNMIITETPKAGEKTQYPLRLISDFRLFSNSNTLTKANPDFNAINHIFIIPDMSLLKAIGRTGYLPRADQLLIKNYSKPSVKSFLKFVLTHEPSFYDGKKLDWLIDQYRNSMTSAVGPNFYTRLVDDIINNIYQIENDFSIRIFNRDKGTYFVRYIKDIE